jgi:Zn-dependent metalloprotease
MYLLLSSLFLASCGESSAPTELFATGSDSELDLAAQLGLEILTQFEPKTRISVADLALHRILIDELGMAHTHVQQYYQGIPVEGGEAIVHLRSDGSPSELTNTLVADILVNTTPYWTENEGVDLAAEATGGWQRITDDPIASLVVLRKDGEDYLAWKVQIEKMDENPSRPLVFIDAHTGDVLKSYENLHTASGTAYYSGNVSINTYAYNGSYYLEDTTRKLGTYSYNYTTTSLYYITDSDDSWTSDSTAVQAHYNAAIVRDYFYYTHGRNGIDSAGGPGYVSSLTGSGKTISSMVHYSRNYSNAF